MALLAFASLAACAEPVEPTEPMQASEYGLAVPAPEEASESGLTPMKLADAAEAKFNEVEASKSGFSEAPALLMLALGSEPIVTGTDKELDVVVPQFGTKSMRITANIDPVFAVQRMGELTLGRTECGAGNAFIVERKGEGEKKVRFVPAKDAPCTISILKMEKENWGDTPEAVHAHAFGMKERTIVVGFATGTLKNDAGESLEVTAAFVLPLVNR